MLTRPLAVRRPLRNAIVVVAYAAGVAALPALAAPGVWKCAGSGGVPVYQDRPCASGSDLKDLAADPPPLSIVPLHIAPPSASVPERTTRRAQAPAPRHRRTEARPEGHAAERKFVREGMTEGEVLARLGSPDMASPKGGRRARWTFLPASGDAQTMTTIRFEDGRVLSVERVTVR